MKAIVRHRFKMGHCFAYFFKLIATQLVAKQTPQVLGQHGNGGSFGGKNADEDSTPQQ
jgi:hypothetical protein